jgi:mannose-6-phosphate isomerase-like protein (cupin superfamily)
MNTFAAKVLVVVTLGASTLACAAPAAQLKSQKFTLAPEGMMQPLLTGAPMTGGMRSGRVLLKPGESMHRHSTEGNEEFLLFLAGRARVVLGAESVPMAAGEVLYIPPHTEHEVHNEGTEEVRYVFTVAPVR